MICMRETGDGCVPLAHALRHGVRRVGLRHVRVGLVRVERTTELL